MKLSVPAPRNSATHGSPADGVTMRTRRRRMSPDRASGSDPVALKVFTSYVDVVVKVVVASTVSDDPRLWMISARTVPLPDDDVAVFTPRLMVYDVPAM